MSGLVSPPRTSIGVRKPRLSPTTPHQTTQLQHEKESNGSYRPAAPLGVPLKFSIAQKANRVESYLFRNAHVVIVAWFF